MIDKNKEMSRRYIGVDDISPVYEESMFTFSHMKGVNVEINNVTQFFPCHQYSVLVPEECRKGAQEEVWEFVKTCYNNMDILDRRKCFGYDLLESILNLGYEKAKEMYDAWVEKNTPKEMTIEEISEALGYEVKIVRRRK